MGGRHPTSGWSTVDAERNPRFLSGKESRRRLMLCLATINQPRMQPRCLPGFRPITPAKTPQLQTRTSRTPIT